MQGTPIYQVTHLHMQEGHRIVLSSSDHASVAPVGSMPKSLSIFRNGNAMCENYEVSEVWVLAEEGTNVMVFLVLWNDLVSSSHF